MFKLKVGRVLLSHNFSKKTLRTLIFRVGRSDVYVLTYESIHYPINGDSLEGIYLFARVCNVPVFGVRAVDCWKWHSGHYFHYSPPPVFFLFSPSRSFLMEGVLGSKNLFYEGACGERVPPSQLGWYLDLVAPSFPSLGKLDQFILWQTNQHERVLGKLSLLINISKSD